VRREWTRTIICAAAQVAALTLLAAWLLRGDEVPYRSALMWSVPLLGAWAGVATARGMGCVREKSRLRRELRLSIPWEEIRP